MKMVSIKALWTMYGVLHNEITVFSVGSAVCGDVRGCDRCTCDKVLHLQKLQPVRSGQRSSVWMEPQQETLRPSGGRRGGHVGESYLYYSVNSCRVSADRRRQRKPEGRK